MSATATCAVCGRTILDGERVHPYVSVEGSHDVCPLCAPRAEAAGWLPADEVDAPALPLPPRRSLFDRVLGRRRDEKDGVEEPFGAPLEPFEPPPESVEVAPDPPAPAAETDLAGDLGGPAEAWGMAEPDDAGKPEDPAEPRRAAEPEAPAEPAPVAPKRRLFGRRRAEDAADEPMPAAPADDAPAPRPDPAGPGMRSRSRPLDDAEAELSPTSRFERAILRFNVSEAGRTVAGLTRTLGPPSVSVGASATGSEDVRITVAWEISWYQWGVDLGDELRPVFEIAKGYEIPELDASARQWNATAVDAGRVVIGAPEHGAERGDAPARGSERGDTVRR